MTAVRGLRLHRHALVLALASASIAAWPAGPALAQAAGAVRDYALAPGPLADVLNGIARGGGMTLVLDPAQLGSRRTRPVHGRYTPVQAIEAALDGSGLALRRDGGSFYSLAAAPPAPAPVPAGEPGAVVALSEVTVSAKRDARAATYDTPGSVDVITREDIERLPPRNTSDLFADTPGVYTANDRQNPALAVNIRGMQDFGRVSVTLDGARQNFQQTGHGNNGSVYIDPELLAGVTVEKGPSTGVGGAGVIAGVVNFRTLDAPDLLGPKDKFGGRINATTGSNAYHFAGSAATAWRPDEHLEFVAALSRKNVGAFDTGTHGAVPRDTRPFGEPVPGVVQYSGQDQWSGLFKATLRPNADHELKFGYVGFDARFTTGSNGFETRNRLRTETITANYVYDPGVPAVDLRANLYYTRTRNDQTPDGTASAPGIASHLETNTVGGSVANTSRFALPYVSAAASYGAEVFYDWTSPNSSLGGPDDPLLSIGATPKGNRVLGGLFTDLKLTHQEWLELDAGLRYDMYRLSGDGQLFSGQIDNGSGMTPRFTSVYTPIALTRHGQKLSPKVTLALKPAQGLQFYASYGQGYRPPAITESLMSGSHPGMPFPLFPNPYLRPEESRSWEIGASYKLDGLALARDKLRAKAAWFDTRVKHYMMNAAIMTPFDQSAFDYRYGFVNLDNPVTFKGLELQMEYDAEVAFFNGSYTRTLSDLGDGSYDPFPFGTRVASPNPGIRGTRDGLLFFQLPPRDKFSLSGGVRLFARKLVLGARWQYASGNPIPMQYGSVNDWSSYHVTDLWAAWQVQRQVTLRLALQNVFDKRYGEPMGTEYYLAPGRTALLTATYTF
ncbi:MULTISPECIES: TonB-dependent hemoglobin/transferrin/lactoferrin family receptor [Cupriavidus]